MPGDLQLAGLRQAAQFTDRSADSPGKPQLPIMPSCTGGESPPDLASSNFQQQEPYCSSRNSLPASIEGVQWYHESHTHKVAFATDALETFAMRSLT